MYLCSSRRYGILTPRHFTLPAAVITGFLLGLSGCRQNRLPGALAVVNDEPISAARVDEYERIHAQNFSGETGEQRRLDVLNQVIDEEILEQRARRFHLEATAEDAAAKLVDIKAPYTREEFEQQLQAAGVTAADLEAEIRRELTIDRILNKDVFSRINVTDADLSTYYTAHQDEFNLPEPRFHLARIDVKAATRLPNGQAVDAAAARANAQHIIQLIHIRLEGGEDFSTLVNNLANVKTAAITSDADIALPLSQINDDPQLRDSLGKMLPGQTTDVLASPDGSAFAIYKLLFREPAGVYGFDDPRVQQYIREKLREQRAELRKTAYLDMLRQQSHIENYYAADLLH